MSSGHFTSVGVTWTASWVIRTISFCTDSGSSVLALKKYRAVPPSATSTTRTAMAIPAARPVLRGGAGGCSGVWGLGGKVGWAVMGSPDVWSSIGLGWAEVSGLLGPLHDGVCLSTDRRASTTSPVMFADGVAGAATVARPPSVWEPAHRAGHQVAERTGLADCR